MCSLGQPIDRLVLLQQGAGQHRLVQLVRTVADRAEAGAAIPLLDRQIAGVAERAAHLDRAVEDGEHDLRDVRLDHAELGAHGRGPVLVHLPGGLEGQQPGGLNLHMGQGNVVLHHLVLAEQLAVRRAGNGPLAHDVERALRLPEPAHRVVDTPAAEPLLRQHEAVARRPDEVVVRHPAVGEDDLGVVAGTAVLRLGMGHRADVAHDVHARRPLGHDEDRRVLVRPALGVGLGEHQRDVCRRGVGREPLVPVDDPLVAVAARPWSRRRSGRHRRRTAR